jgi:two-component system chemotaxis response regulator CheY
MPLKRVLSVGQCFADHSSIRRTLEEHFAAQVIPAATVAEVKARLQQERYDLILVNRIFDADGVSGLALIEQLKQDEKSRDLPVMLVSNYEDAQQEAVARGALPGFGKASLGQPQMLGRLRKILGSRKDEG